MPKFRALMPLVAAFVSLTTLSHAQSDPSKPVASVNGEAISGMDYFRRMEFLPGVGRMIGDRYVQSYPGYIALQQLINERLMLQVAKERGVMPSEAEVKAEVDVRLKKTPKMLETLTKVGLSRADLELQIRVEIAEFKIVTQGVTITNQEVDEFYKKNPSLYTVPKLYKLSLISVSEDKKEAVDEALKTKPFADVARSLSQDPSALDGGSIGNVPANVFAPAVQSALDATKIGSSTDWIAGSSGWFKFQVNDIKPEERMVLDDSLRTQIRRQMMIDRGRARNNIEKLMGDARKKAKIVVNQSGLDEMIKEWQKGGIID